MISNESKQVVFNAPDPMRNNVLSKTRPETMQTAAQRDGADVVVSFSKQTDVMLIDNSTPFDAKKVEFVRQQLAAGALRIDAVVVAERMMADRL